MLRIERIWRAEARRRAANKCRRERINRNWPIHAARITEVFQAFADLAERDGVHMTVTPPDFLIPLTERAGRLANEIRGSSYVGLQFGLELTGERLVTESEGSTSIQIDYELGARLIVHHSDTDAIVQVFFEAPREVNAERPEPLLYTHTHNTDDVTYDWASRLISKFLVFNRFESRLQDYKLTDSWRVRWWRFRDIRNRRGYLKNFQHFFTPWELVLVAAVAAIPVLAVLKLFIG